MQASLDSTHARVHRLLARLSSLLAASTNSDKSPSSELASTLPLSHLFRLLPLSYPDPTHFANAPATISIRVVAVTELGLHPRGALTHAVPLSAHLIAGRLHGSILSPVALPIILRPAQNTAGETLALDSESGKTTLELVWDPEELKALVAHIMSSEERSEGVGLFVYIGPTGERDQEQVVPVVMGPFDVSGTDVRGQAGGESVDVYRPFPVTASPDPMSKMCLVKEDWGLGIPGKVWDSAVVLSRLLTFTPLLSSVLPDSDPSVQRSILDLSSGTGHLTCLLSHLLPPTSAPDTLIHCTDLPEALPLLHANTAAFAGSTPIHVAALPWGESLPTSVDLAICSDVLYEAHFFDALATTLRGSVKVGGKVVIGYKPRGLTVEEEDGFLVGRMTGDSNIGRFKLVQVVRECGRRFGVVVVVYERLY